MTAARVFLPPIDSRWRFKGDWTPPYRFLESSSHEDTVWGFDGRYNRISTWKKHTGDNTDDNDWPDRLEAWVKQYKLNRGAPDFGKGTVIQIERYHVSRSGENQITVKVLASPSKLLTPKKLGGSMRGPGRLYFMLSEFNTLPELEQVDEHP